MHSGPAEAHRKRSTPPWGPRGRWANDELPIPPLDRIELALEDALRRRLITLDELAAELAGSDWGDGPRLLREVLARRPAGAPPTESYMETRCVQLTRGAGLPEPARQVDIVDHRGVFIGRVDLRIEVVVIECDGQEFHRDSFAKDRVRWSRLVAEGFSPMVLIYDQVERAPEATASLIRRTLEQSRTRR